MNGQQVRTNTTLIPIKRMLFEAPTEKGAFPQKPEKRHRWKMLADPKSVIVLIVSSNPFVTDWLRGLLESQGYDATVVSDPSEAIVHVQKGCAHVVFIDDACMCMGSFKNFELRAQNLIQEGAPIILLADEQTKQYVEGLPEMKFFRIVRKPVGYQQISQVMADLLNVRDEKHS